MIDRRRRLQQHVAMDYRFACITGATSGIGMALARALPSHTDLLLTGRDASVLAELAAELAAPERRVETLAADLSRDDGRDALIAAAAAQPIDLLVHSAGLGAFGRAVDNPAAAEREIVEVNVVAPVVVTRALLPGMLARAEAEGWRAGLILLASTAAFAPLPYFATYAASKVFDLWYAEGLASELHDRPIDVVAVCPGPTRTAFFQRAGGTGLGDWGMTPAAVVAEDALAGLSRGGTVTVGLRNRAYRGLTAVVPRRWLRAAIRGAMARGRR
jgi:short-subunit dehydrogenase